MTVDAGTPTLAAEAAAASASRCWSRPRSAAAAGACGSSRRRDELAEAVASARREAASAFGDGTVFLERYVVDPRHVEVQIFGDAHGSVVAPVRAGVLDPAPAPEDHRGVRRRRSSTTRCAASCARPRSPRARRIGYVGAGTVEFVWTPPGAFWFLEVNTRLQVEHPVTELVTGLDLVALQLRVAEGEPLPAEVDRGAHRRARHRGAALRRGRAGRVPARHRHAAPLPRPRRPACGSTPASPTARWSAPHYDPMLAKVIAHGATRADAARRLRRALRGRADPRRGDQPRPARRRSSRDAEFLRGSLRPAAAARARRSRGSAAGAPWRALARGGGPRASGLPSGWRNVPAHPQQVAYSVDGAGGRGRLPVPPRRRRGRRRRRAARRRRWCRRPRSGSCWTSTACGAPSPCTAPTKRCTSTTPPGRPRSAGCRASPTRTRRAHAGSLLAPMPGAVVRVAAAAGDRVDGRAGAGRAGGDEDGAHGGRAARRRAHGRCTSSRATRWRAVRRWPWWRRRDEHRDLVAARRRRPRGPGGAAPRRSGGALRPPRRHRRPVRRPPAGRRPRGGSSGWGSSCPTPSNTCPRCSASGRRAAWPCRSTTCSPRPRCGTRSSTPGATHIVTRHG